MALVEGDGAGYDVRSYTETGEQMNIEVKTTCSDENTAFYISSNEVACSGRDAEIFYLYRLFNFKGNHASMYVVEGDVRKSLQLDAVNYRARVT